MGPASARPVRRGAKVDCDSGRGANPGARSVQVKSWGISTAEAMAAAVEAGAALVGLVFYPPSPRAVTPAQGAVLAKPVPPGVVRTGLLVDADDDTIAHILDEVPLDQIGRAHV